MWTQLLEGTRTCSKEECSGSCAFSQSFPLAASQGGLFEAPSRKAAGRLSLLAAGSGAAPAGHQEIVRASVVNMRTFTFSKLTTQRSPFGCMSFRNALRMILASFGWQRCNTICKDVWISLQQNRLKGGVCPGIDTLHISPGISACAARSQFQQLPHELRPCARVLEKFTLRSRLQLAAAPADPK